MQILQLERRLEDQVAVRHVLEKALGYTSSCHVSTNEIAVPKVVDSCPHLMDSGLYFWNCLLACINSLCS